MRRRHHLGHLVTYGEGLHLPNLCCGGLRWAVARTNHRRVHCPKPVSLVALGRLDDLDHIRRGAWNRRLVPAGDVPARLAQVEGEALARSDWRRPVQS